MRRRLGYGTIVLAAVTALTAAAFDLTDAFAGTVVADVAVGPVVTRALYALAVVLCAYAAYLLIFAVVLARVPSKRRAHDVRNILRLVLGAVAVVGVLGIVTEQWVGVLVSLGVVGFAVTFALQQPLLSLLAWGYIMVSRPYTVGDRVEIGGARGDVIAVDFLVTTVWEIDGDLVATNQPSGRVVTVPNSMVLSSEVTNYGGAGIPYIWNEVTVQVAYETDLEYARETMTRVADDYLGDEMAARVERYRERLAETPVELEVNERPTVNVRQGESWVELRLRYLVHPRRGTRVRNALYERILAEFNAAPDRVSFPVGRNR